VIAALIAAIILLNRAFVTLARHTKETIRHGILERGNRRMELEASCKPKSILNYPISKEKQNSISAF
jgi:hypothetical protein